MRVYTVINAETKELVACISEHDSIVQNGYEVIVLEESEVKFSYKDSKFYLADEVK